MVITETSAQNVKRGESNLRKYQFGNGKII